MSLISFLNTKAKPVTVYLLSLCGMGLFMLSTAAATAFFEKGCLIIGILMMVAAIPFHIGGKKRPFGYIISIALNFIGSGFVVSEYYAARNHAPAWSEMLLAVIFPVGILTLTYLMLQVWSKTKGVTVAVAVTLNAVLLLIMLVLWVREGAALYSFVFFASLISLYELGVFAVTVNHDERAVLRDMSFGSFGSFVILTVVVVLVLSEGSILDGLDIDFGGGNKKNKK